MNKRHYLMAAMCLMTLAACTQKTELPEDPKDKEEYRDSQGHSWIYNWALMPSAMNGLTTTHYYYPNTGSWTDANGTRVNAPSGVKVSSPAGSKSKSSGRVFGSSHRSSGVHA